MLRQTQARTQGVLHTGCNHGLSPPRWAWAAQSCLSCILNKLGPLRDSAGVWSIPAGMQLAQSASACWAGHTAWWGHSSDNDPEGRGSFATFPRNINSYTHPEELSASSKNIAEAEVGEICAAYSSFKIRQLMNKRYSQTWTFIKGKNNRQDIRCPTPNLWKLYLWVSTNPRATFYHTDGASSADFSQHKDQAPQEDLKSRTNQWNPMSHYAQLEILVRFFMISLNHWIV